MATSERPVQRSDRLADEAIGSIGRQLRLARIGHGLSQRSLEDATGLSHAEISRIERGRVADVPVRSLIRVASAVGLALPSRLFPSGDAIRDAGHARLLARFRAQLHPSLRWRTEVPLPIPGDRRSWDAITGAASWRIGIEAETVIGDSQALERRLSLKRRDGGVHNVILLVADTPRNRRSLTAAIAAFTDLPLRTRAILAALRAGVDPGGSGIVIM
jgi:transcriptional regulator with XRE-family HTH domain